MNIIQIISIYTISGLTRGAALYGVSTIIIEMTKQSSVYPYETPKTVITLMSTGCLIGSIIGSAVGPQIIFKLGRIRSLRFMSLLILLVNILMFPSIHWVYFFVLRIISGISSVFLVTIVPQICIQQVEPKHRGIIGSLTNLNMWTGKFIGDIIQYLVCQDAHLYPVTQVFATVMSVAMVIMSYTIKEQTQQHSSQTAPQKENVWQTKYQTCFAVAISVGMCLGSTGFTPILQYSTLIFKSSFDSPKSGAIGAIITSGITTVSCFLALPVVRKFPRKILFLVGQILMMLCCLAMIIILYLNLSKKTSDNIILALTVIYIVAYSFSTGTLFFVLMGEIFPLHVKPFFVNLTMGTNMLSILIVTFIFPLMKQQQNYIIYFVWTGLVLILINAFVPESFNKTSEMINEKMMRRRNVLKTELVEMAKV
ncbi:Sugar_(And other) transporter family protein [Hexamita inflata]|uniref:Sugar (And other) transporter family protein n=1 Tax=Hexamita inflata TaxID=28002 RepID=A0AA86PNH5_9EUKA|nr:Sugar (And other) transporter family protein [Hexamita inflata]